jgi:hypothetical protein
MTQSRMTFTRARLARHAQKRHADNIHACGTRTRRGQKTCGRHADEITLATLAYDARQLNTRVRHPIDTRGRHTGRQQSRTTFNRSTLTDNINTDGTSGLHSPVDSQGLTSYGRNSRTTLTRITLADYIHTDIRRLNSRWRNSRTTFTQTTLSDYIHRDETRGIHWRGRHSRTTFTRTTLAEYEGESNENRKIFFKFNLLNESGTQLYHFST